MELEVDVQYAVGTECSVPVLPSRDDIRMWVRTALEMRPDAAQLTVRIVGEEESARLNEAYRHRSGSTNVLSFPFEHPDMLRPPLLGDVVICAPVVLREANSQHKSEEAHWAHLVVHGVLHLLGYGHEDAHRSHVMEGIEKSVLARLGYPDPYQEDGASIVTHP